MKKLVWLSVALLAGSLPGMGAGIIIIDDGDIWNPPIIVPPPHPIPPPRPIPPPYPIPRPRPLPPPVWAPLEVSYVQGNVHIKDQIALTSVEEEFYNPNPRQLEGTFLFPVPKGANINKFSMEINGKQVEAELMRANKARDIYEDIVRHLRDPALLEYAGRDLFKVRIFPIEPHSKKRIKLSYTQILKADGGLVGFTFPLNTEKYSAKPLRNVSLKVDLESKRPLKSIYSPTHKVEVKRHGEHRATVGYEGSDLKPDSDFQLFFAEEEGEFGASLLTSKSEEDEGYFLLLVTPSSEIKKEKVMPKDVVFVLDTSGSMAGAKLEQAKKALLFCIENLNEDDRFEIVRFSTEVEPLFDKLVDANPENRKRAEKFIDRLKPTGGTAIDEALRQSLGHRPEKGERPYVVIFLTDGRPTIGETDEDLIVKHIRKTDRANTRVFCFGIGTDVNTHLLDRVAEETKAFTQYVLPDEDLEIKVSSFFTKIKEPVLANPEISFPEGVRATKMYPSPLPDLYKGEQLVLVGRYSGHSAGKLQLEGMVNDEKRTFEYEVKFPKDGSDHDFIPRLWATRRVGYLLDEIRLHGENKELKDEVTDLARRYNIVTPYTAYLIIEDERHREVDGHFRTVRPEPYSDSQQRPLQFGGWEQERSGAAAVGSARSMSRLKSADSAPLGISGGREEAFRGNIMSQATPASPRSMGGDGSAGRNYAFSSPEALSSQVRKLSEASAEQSRFVNGRTFYLNGREWVDSEIQKTPQAERVRIAFASPEYFDLLKKHPEAWQWLSIGQNLQLVLGGKIYEIYEPEASSEKPRD